MQTTRLEGLAAEIMNSKQALERAQVAAIAEMQASGWSWDRIGRAIGMSNKGAAKWFRKRMEEQG